MKTINLMAANILGFALFVLTFLGIQFHSTAIAAMPLGATEAIVISQNVSEAIDEFLNSIPSDYYTLMKVNTLKNLVRQKQIFLVDVREPSEYNSGHIRNAINIPLRTLSQNLSQIPTERSVVLYCSSGYRTAMGVMTLRLLGYTNVRGFPPSIKGWKQAGEPLERGLS